MAKNIKRKVKKNVVRGVVHIKATFNNTLVTISDADGDVGRFELCHRRRFSW
jgi:small subunit ribosomal protein S11